MKKPISDILLLMLGLTVLFAIALDASRTGKSAGKRLSYASYESNKPEPKGGLICGGIDNLNDGPNKLRLVKRFSTARANNLRDDTDRLATEAKAAQRLINYANENPDSDDLKDATDDSQDDADESEDATDESEDTSGDSQDDADGCVE